MTKLPRDVPAKKLIGALEKAGFHISRISGSHYVMVKGEIRTVVPFHSPIKVGTLRAILNQVGMTVEEFRKLL